MCGLCSLRAHGDLLDIHDQNRQIVRKTFVAQISPRPACKMLEERIRERPRFEMDLLLDGLDEPILPE